MEPTYRTQIIGSRLCPSRASPNFVGLKNTHPFVAGDQVAVFAFDHWGRPFLEGRAVIVAPTTRAHVYRVQFNNEKRSRLRFVNPEWQADAERSFALLLACWRANGPADPQIDDFFPNDSSE
jgi:hypothetical protein